MTTRRILLTADAAGDLDEIHDYLAQQSGLARADAIVDGIHAQLLTLATMPVAASYPPELLDWGIREFRQAHHKSYRMIFRDDGRRLVVYLIAHGRRDFRALLQRRLLA